MDLGPSGHGKTKLAKCMGDLLSAEFLAIDSTEMNHSSDLFGPKAPCPGYEEGSALNNFLCRNHGQRSVVFLDDFEKMGSTVFHSLLIPFGEGEIPCLTFNPLLPTQTLKPLTSSREISRSSYCAKRRGNRLFEGYLDPCHK